MEIEIGEEVGEMEGEEVREIEVEETEVKTGEGRRNSWRQRPFSRGSR